MMKHLTRLQSVREAAREALRRFGEIAVPLYMPEDFQRAARYARVVASAHREDQRISVVTSRHTSSDGMVYTIVPRRPARGGEL